MSDAQQDPGEGSVNAHVYARGLARGTCAPRDEADLATVLPLLDKRARTWLRGAVEHVHPGHRWLEQLS